MDQKLLDDIISTSIGGAAGGAVAGLVLYGVQGFHAWLKAFLHGRRVYCWLKSESSREGAPDYRSTKAIASHTNLTLDRVRYLCSRDKRIHMSTGERDDLWTLNEQKKEPQYQMHVLNRR